MASDFGMNHAVDESRLRLGQVRRVLQNLQGKARWLDVPALQQLLQSKESLRFGNLVVRLQGEWRLGAGLRTRTISFS